MSRQQQKARDREGRAPLIPGFAAVKQAALDHGAFGASISGAGPSVFGWFEDRASAEAASHDMRAAFSKLTRVDAANASEAR